MAHQPSLGRPLVCSWILVAVVGCTHVTAPPAHDAAVMDVAVAMDTPDVAALPDTSVVNTVAPPRLIAPLSTATVTSQNPTLRWALAPGSDGVRIQVCRDRACTVVVQSGDAVGTSVRVPMGLAPGVYYWRLASRTGTEVSDVWSAPWEMFVGHRSANVDTSWGTVADFNGDGLAEVIGGGGGVAIVFMGGAGGVATVGTALHSPDGRASFGNSLASAGDIDGDGYADLVVGEPAVVASTTGALMVYLGGASGLSASPMTITGPTTDSGFATAVTSAGDVNGDGYADVIASGNGAAYVYLGSASGLAPTPVVLTGPAGSLFGWPVSNAGDANGDGFGDLVVAGIDALYGYNGGPGGPMPGVTLAGPAGVATFGTTLGCAGDVNGDGYTDLVAGAGGAYVYFGSARGFGASPLVVPTPPTEGAFGTAVAGAGDVNGDGLADVIVGAPFGDRMSLPDQAFVYFGAASGLMGTPFALTVGTMMGFGASVGGAGDVNGDGFDDVVVGAFGAGQVSVYAGGATGPNTSPTVLVGPGVFGTSVASTAYGKVYTAASPCTATSVSTYISSSSRRPMKLAI